ncbi:hypothetical protein KO561_18365 [Radiobacillus kanasensis]|uniref:hypothetical protein n=1 Tax=Radiobacillus kanasensis TaxID=2844358 RepID=UPI001E50DF8D|nr:hypothetical protein [Radiobacillus kanasensis]UFT99119.1 hypothetical protein KO561_18365 [Radiobacillus kanasensis]
MSRNNEQGMALALVLMVIAIISLLSLSVIGMTVHNAKQFDTTESNIQTLDLAEMGFTYYETSFQDFYKRKMEEINVNIQNNMISDFESGELKDVTVYEEIVATKLLEAVNVFHEQLSFSTNNGNADSLLLAKPIGMDSSFQLAFPHIPSNIVCTTCNQVEDTPGEHIEVTLQSTGMTEGTKSRTVRASFSLNIGPITIETDGSGNPNEVGDYGIHIIKPTNLSTCSEDDVREFGRKSCSFEGPVEINNINRVNIEDASIVVSGSLTTNQPLNNGIENSTIFVTGDGSFNSPINGIDASNLYIGGTANFQNLNQGVNGSTLIIEENSYFNAPINGIDHSKFLIGGSATFENINQGINNSLLIIEENATFSANGGTISGMENTTIHVLGNANFNNRKFNKVRNARICVRGQVTELPKDADYVYSPSLGTDETTFNDVCALPESSSGTISEEDISFDWSFDTANVEYEYQIDE